VGVVHLLHERVHRDDGHLVADADVSGRANRVPGVEGLDDLVGRHLVGAELVGVDADDDGALAAAEGRRCRDAGERGEHRPDLEEGLVLNLADALRLAGKNEVADGDAPRVKPGDERRDGPRRHERPRPRDVTDGLGHRLGHVRARVEVELHQGHALDVLRLYVVDAGDVEEVVLVIVGEQPLHLGGVHAAVRLGDVDDREVQVREDVDGHPEEGEAAPECDGDDEHHHGERSPHGEDDGVHETGPFGKGSGSRPKEIVSSVRRGNRERRGHERDSATMWERNWWWSLKSRR